MPPTNFVANILCRQHNSDLSPIDDVGIAAFDVFRRASELQEVRRRYVAAGFAPIPFAVEQYSIDGYKYESWLLKTAINVEIGGSHGLPIGPTAKDVPPLPELVEIAYGRKRFDPNAGLYFIGRFGGPLHVAERVRYESWVREAEDGHEYVSAAMFLFYGCGFVLNLDPTSTFPETLNTPEGELKLLYRPYGFKIELEGSPSQKITLEWGQSRSK